MGAGPPLLPHMQQSTLSVASSAGLFAIAAPDPVAQPAAAAAGGTLLQPPPLDASDFDLLHQCVRVELDFEREHLRGSNEMRLRVARGSTEVRLNASSQLRLLAISLDGAPLELSAASIARSTDDVVPRDKRRTRDLGSFRACHGAAVFASQDGELTIPLPPRLLAEAAARRDDDDPYAAADAAAADGDGGVEVTLLIEYEVVKPDGGVAFVRGGGGGASYAVTVGEEGSARRWFPCVDRLETRCEATLHVTVRAGLAVFGSGRPIGTSTTGDGTPDAKTTFSFSHEFFDGGPPRGAPQPDGTPTCAARASQLGFVAGISRASTTRPCRASTSCWACPMRTPTAREPSCGRSSSTPPASSPPSSPSSDDSSAAPPAPVARPPPPPPPPPGRWRRRLPPTAFATVRAWACSPSTAPPPPPPRASTCNERRRR